MTIIFCLRPPLPQRNASFAACRFCAPPLKRGGFSCRPPPPSVAPFYKQQFPSFLFADREPSWRRTFFSGKGATWVALSLYPPFSCLLNQGFLPKRKKKKVPFLGTSSARGKEEQTFALVDKEEGGAFLLLAPPFSSPVSNALLLFSPFPPSFLAASEEKGEDSFSARCSCTRKCRGRIQPLFLPPQNPSER